MQNWAITDKMRQTEIDRKFWYKNDREMTGEYRKFEPEGVVL